MRKFFPFVVLLFLLSSCASSFQDIEVVKFNDFKILDYSPEKTQAEIILTLKNPNNFNVSLTKVNIDILVNGSDVGVVSLNEKVKFLKNSTSTHSFIVNGDYEKIQSNLLANAFSIMLSKKIDIQGKGKAKGKAFLIGKSFDVDFQEQLSLDDLDLGF